MSQCKAWLDNYKGQYYPGAQIQGKVVLNLDGDTKLRGVKVKIICHEHTEWLGTESYYEDNEQKSRDTLFKGDNDAFATELILYGGQSGSTSLPVGQHIYPFNVVLPNYLPGSFHGEYGSISYKLLAIVDRPMALDYEDELIFVVLAPVNLGLLQKPDLLAPSSYSVDKTVCCWCCAQGPITLDVELPKKTLVPGETVNISARLSNMSNTNIEGVHMELKQIITCLVDDPSKEEKEQNNILVDLNEVGLGVRGEHTYTFNVMLPMNVPIPNFSQCKLFKVRYVYKVEAKLPSMHSDLEVYMYPEVGNIEVNQAPDQPSGFSAPATTGGYMSGYPSYPEGPGTHYPPPIGGVPVYPSLTPNAPPTGFNPKSQEILRGGNRNEHSYPEQPPPSYDSVNTN